MPMIETNHAVLKGPIEIHLPLQEGGPVRLRVHYVMAARHDERVIEHPTASAEPLINTTYGYVSVAETRVTASKSLREALTALDDQIRSQEGLDAAHTIGPPLVAPKKART